MPDEAPRDHGRARRASPRVPSTGADFELDHGVRRDRGDHLVHEHVEPAGDDRRRARRARRRSSAACTRKPWVKSSLAPGSKVVTEYYEQAGLQTLPRRARLPDGRLRLHDVHRQLGPAAGRDLARDRRGRPRRLLGALGQPQLRGADPSRGEGELSRVAAARRRVRARGPHGHRPRDRAARQGRDGEDVYLRDLWPSAHEVGETIATSMRGEHVPRHVRRRLHRRRRPGASLPAPEGELFRVGARLDLRAPAAVLRGDGARARHRPRRRGRALSSSGSATR